LTSNSSNGGASIIVDFAPEPIIVRLLLILICSVYVPGNTFIRSPSFAAFIADCIVGKSIVTTISAEIGFGCFGGGYNPSHYHIHILLMVDILNCNCYCCCHIRNHFHSPLVLLFQ